MHSYFAFFKKKTRVITLKYTFFFGRISFIMDLVRKILEKIFKRGLFMEVKERMISLRILNKLQKYPDFRKYIEDHTKYREESDEKQSLENNLDCQRD